MSTNNSEQTWPLTFDQMAALRRKASQERAAAVAQFGRGFGQAVRRMFGHRPVRTPVGRVAGQAG